ncbi:pas domain s-box family protein [Stylonychia lemnae]|uniref:Pas domain s-box family protein n=1 Tax=Stylonychia lemnae TaxID=5949 RepID=A0A078A999_STYLE|nr:pas domain s-box family protein [Stylonychia lemnae]|eukprot:CDW78804.1 pas domain s-box family protein [Stylonychia lemnae]
MKRKKEDQEHVSRKEILITNLCYLTRALVKNNIIKQNGYIVLLTLEYLMMLFTTLRLADVNTFQDVFGSIESFLDVGIDDNQTQITSDTPARIVCVVLCTFELTLTIIYALKYFNMEVPNDEVQWSYNQSGGIYFKLLLQFILCTQELYRPRLTERAVTITILLIVMAVQVLIIVYRINTPNIFNQTIHNYTLLLESSYVALTFIGLVALLTGRDIFSTLAYLLIFIPIMVKIIFFADQHRKHQVLFKLKNEDSLSKNEYLICLTHVLKMIKRQSETDLAQLMSFTYQHKLSCYNTQCICQFFTQYCQDPQGYLDDGVKLIQIQDEGIKDFLEDQISQSRDNESQAQSQVLGDNSYLVESTINGIISNIDILNSNMMNDLTQTEQTRNNLSQSNMNTANNIQNNNNINNIDNMATDERAQLGNDPGELGLMGFFNRGYILRGAAYSSYDKTMFKLLEKKTCKNTSFSLISIYFQYAYQHNIYQAVFAIVKAARSQKRSLTQRLQFSVTEFYLLELILSEFKVTNSKEELNYSDFIERNQMQQNLDWLFEDTSSDIINFWKIFKEEQANVQKAYVMGLQISQNISQIRDFTKKLEESQMIKDYNKYYYYAMFYQNLLNDKQNYNQMIGNLKNQLMIRNMRKKNSRFGQITDINDLGFAIISFEDDKTLGKFKYANRVACQLLNTDEEAIIEKSVKQIMPELICHNHELFIRRFLAEGLPRFIGRVRTIFIKDFSGYIKPVQFYINFHYNSKFSYSFILHIDPISSITFQNHQVIPMKHVFVIISDFHSNIQNICLNTKKLTGLTQKTMKVQEEILGRKVRMEDVIFQIGRLEQFLIDNRSNYMNNQIVKVRTFNNSNDQNYITCSLQYEEITYLKGSPSEFKERVYLFIPVSKIPEYDNTSMISSNNINNSQFQSSQNNSGQENQGIFSSFYFTQSVEVNIANDDKFGSMSQSRSSKSSSTVTTSSSLSYTKGMLFQQKSPKILKIYLYIVFGVLFSFITVSSINFIIYIQKKNLVNLQIKFNNLINQRNTCLIQTLSNLKSLHLISADQTKNSKVNISNIIPNINRFDYYNQYIIQNSLQLLDYHEEFKSLSQRYETLGTQSNSDLFTSINLKYLSKNNQVYTQNNSLDYGLSLIVSNIGMITLKDLLAEKLPMNLQDLILKNIKSNQTASDLLRNIYFVFENGMNELNYLGALQEQYIQRNTKNTSDESKLYINLMSFISIGIITLIGVFTFPLLGRIEERKISVLKFFNLLNLEQIQNQINMGREFQEEFNNLSRNMNQNKNKNEYLENDEDYYVEDDSEEYDQQTMQQIENNLDKKGSLKIQHLSVNNKKINQDLVEVEDISFDDVRDQTNSREQFFKAIVQNENEEENKKINDEQSDDEIFDTNRIMKHRVKFTEQTKEMKNSNGITVSFAPVSDQQATFQPKKKSTQGLRQKKSPKKSRRNSEEKYTSMFDIQKLFKKIQQNEAKQIKISEMRKMGSTDKEISEELKQKDEEMKLKKQKKELSDSKQQTLKDDIKSSKLQNVFQNPGGNKRSNIMQKANEEMKEEQTKVGKLKHNSKQQKKQSNLKIDRSIKMQPLFKAKQPNQMNEIKEDDSESKNSDDENQQNKDPKNNKYNISKAETALRQLTSRTEYIQDQLEKIALKEKLKLALYVIFVLIFLNSNLIASYYIGQKTFSEDSEALNVLATFYHKENYLDNLIFFTQEEFIQNKTIIINGTDAADHYLQQSQTNEQGYNNIRKSYPIFLSNIQDQIDKLESNEICKTVFETNLTKQESCKTAYDSIFQRGLTSTLYMIFTYTQNLQVRFTKEIRTQQFLTDRIGDPKLKDLVDLFNEYLHDALNYLEELVTKAAIEYFDQLSQQYLILYTAYIGVSIILCFFFGFYVFKKLKQQVMTSTNILAIIPLEDLENKDRVKIEAFLNQ